MTSERTPRRVTRPSGGRQQPVVAPPARPDAAIPSSPPSSPRPGNGRATTSRPASISFGVAALTWLGGWLAGNIAGTVVLTLSGHADTDSSSRPVWVSAATAIALWTPQIVALVVASRRFATGRPLGDFAVRFRPIDLVGIPIGVLSQLVVLRLVYWPLQNIWPDTFSNDQLERNARELYDRATGIWVVILVAVVVVGAPLVEELVYRGLLQGAARRRLNDGLALGAVAAFFALIHFRPVEYPGLFAFGLVLGACVVATDRIGMSILAHMSFNATALALIASP